MGSKTFWIVLMVLLGLFGYTYWYMAKYPEAFGHESKEKVNYHLQIGHITNIGTCNTYSCKVEVLRPSGELEYWNVEGNAIVYMPVYRRCWEVDGKGWCDSYTKSHKYGDISYDMIEKFTKDVEDDE